MDKAREMVGDVGDVNSPLARHPERYQSTIQKISKIPWRPMAHFLNSISSDLFLIVLIHTSLIHRKVLKHLLLLKPQRQIIGSGINLMNPALSSILQQSFSATTRHQLSIFSKGVSLPQTATIGEKFCTQLMKDSPGTLPCSKFPPKTTTPTLALSQQPLKISKETKLHAWVLQSLCNRLYSILSHRISVTFKSFVLLHWLFKL